MATAVTKTVEPSGVGPSAVNPRTRLGTASLVGAAFVIAGVAAAAYVVPQVWKSAVSPVTAPLGGMADGFLRVVAQVAAAGLVIWAGTAVAGKNPPRGLRGGILLVVSAAIAIFFVVRAVGLNLEDQGMVGQLVTLVVGGGLLGLGFRGLFSAGGQKRMVQLEEQGWLHTFGYKQSQGQKVRRYTLLGLLLVGWSGVYSLITHESLGRGDWAPALPFTTTAAQVPTLEGSSPPVPAWIGWRLLGKDEVRNLGLPLLDAVQYSVPLLLAALTFWLAWRAANMPVFADFLIATEAEMNKVSWSSRKRLVQDTVVVLVTTFLLTVFLLVTDLFWGWLLSAVKVLPGQAPTATQVDATGGKKVGW